MLANLRVSLDMVIRYVECVTVIGCNCMENTTLCSHIVTVTIVVIVTLFCAYKELHYIVLLLQRVRYQQKYVVPVKHRLV